LWWKSGRKKSKQDEKAIPAEKQGVFLCVVLCFSFFCCEILHLDMYIPSKFLTYYTSSKKKGATVMFKKIGILLAALLLLSQSVMAYPYYLETYGEAVPRADGLLHVFGVALTDDAWDEVVLDMGHAEVYDLRTGFISTVWDIYEGDAVRAVYEPNYSIDGLPLARAVTVYLHAGEPDAADLRLTVSDNIRYTNEACAFVTPDGKYRVTLTDDTLLLDGYGYQLSFYDIEPGMEMFVWASSVTASFPGQLFPDKVVLLD